MGSKESFDFENVKNAYFIILRIICILSSIYILSSSRRKNFTYKQYLIFLNPLNFLNCNLVIKPDFWNLFGKEYALRFLHWCFWQFRCYLLVDLHSPQQNQYFLIGWKTKASCLNLAYNLLIEIKVIDAVCIGGAWEMFRRTFFVAFMGLITRSGRSRHKVLNIQWTRKGYQNQISENKVIF